MPNENVRVYADQTGYYVTDEVDTPDPVTTDVYWSDKQNTHSGDISAPSFQYLESGGYIQHQLIVFSIPLLPQTDVIHANLVYMTDSGVAESSLHDAESINVSVKAFNDDSWDEGIDGPNDNIDAVSMWAGSMTATVAESAITVHNIAGKLFLVADIAEVLQSIIDRGGWAKDNTVLFFIHLDSISDPIQGQEFVNCQSILTDKYAYLDVEYFYDPGATNYDRRLEQTLDFFEVITGRNANNWVYDDLEFDEDIIVVHDSIRSVSDDLDISDFSIGYLDLAPIIEDLLIITDYMLGYASRSKSVEDLLEFEQTFCRNTGFNKQICSQQLDIDQDISVVKAYPRELFDDLSFSDDIGHDKHNRSLVQTLTINQDISFEATLDTHSVTDELDITDEMSFSIFASRTVEDTLTLTQLILGYMEGSNTSAVCSRFDLQWAPFASNTFPEKPVIVPGVVTLTQGANSITLPPPNMGDKEELMLTRIQRKTRGGDLKTFSDDSWPKIRTFRYKFDNLPQQKVIDFHTFLNTTLGLEIHLVDHEGREWDGYIVNPQGEAASYARTCGSTTEFDFDGVEA